MARHLRAMIDTTAERTILAPDLVSALGLTQTGQVLHELPDGNVVVRPTYDVVLKFPSGFAHGCEAVPLPVQVPEIDCLVGRDVLRRLVLVYTGPENSF